MRLHSTLFVPVKFAYLPQHLKWQLTALIRKETLMNAGLALLTLFAGPYSVPMCALIQLVHPTATVPASSRPKKADSDLYTDYLPPGRAFSHIKTLALATFFIEGQITPTASGVHAK
jgi:hypothetical protein